MGIEEYEAYLDELDTHLLVGRDGILRSTFNTPYAVKLADCKTPAEIMHHAKAFSVSLLDTPSAQTTYLTRRWTRLASEYHRLRYDFKPFLQSIDILRVNVEARPSYEWHSGDTILSLKIDSPRLPCIHFERDMLTKGSLVKISKPLILIPGQRFTAHADRVDVLHTKSYMLIEIFPVGEWTASVDIPTSSMAYAEQNYRHGNRFLLSPDIWYGESERIHKVLRLLFKDLGFSYTMK